MSPYERKLIVSWSDVDINGHVRHTRYADYGTDTRIQFFIDHGMPPARFLEFGVGPIIFEEQNKYLAEAHLADALTVDFTREKVGRRGRTFVLHHTVRKEDEKRTVVAQLRLTGGWLSHERRRLVTPPEEVIAVFDKVTEFEAG